MEDDQELAARIEREFPFISDPAKFARFLKTARETLTPEVYAALERQMRVTSEAIAELDKDVWSIAKTSPHARRGYDSPRAQLPSASGVLLAANELPPDTPTETPTEEQLRGAFAAISEIAAHVAASRLPDAQTLEVATGFLEVIEEIARALRAGLAKASREVG
jgi:hypothetical protein